MANLTDLYTEFFRIDLDARGGYARVADVVSHQTDGTSIHRAFKLMRHELGERQKVGIQRFENELKVLVEITKDRNAPAPITRICDSGFAPVELSQTMHKLREGEKLSPKLEIVSTGIDVQRFLETKFSLMEGNLDRWVPYLVVELAPYDDSLLRQIKPRSANEITNLYRLPVGSMVEMGVQLLGVIEYLHKKLHMAYIDWKPEHIYWNGSLKQVKLIDWNVSNRLADQPNDRQIIREDLRMFCGAALYCSLALNDPEDLKRSIGPAPALPREEIPPIAPRYWTDKPNFYEQDAILDEQIKQIVQKGLDPKQGFNSPQEFRSALIQYAEERAKQGDVASGENKNIDLMAKPPQEAIDYFKRARSYIAAKDYSLAATSLEVALETARAAGMNYPDAEKLLHSVQDILRADEFRGKVKQAVKQQQWENALQLYEKAIGLAPTNAVMKKEFEGLHDLLQSESQLRKRGFARLFTNTYRLQSALEATKEIVDTRNPLHVSVKQQLKQIRLFQFGGVFALLVFVILGLSARSSLFGLIPDASATSTSMPTHTPAETATRPTLSPIPVLPSPTPSVTPTVTLTPTATNTLEPSPTVTVVLNYGVLNVSFFFPLQEPNGRRIGEIVESEHILAIVDQKEDRGQLWYKCLWEKDGMSGEGWILAANIQFVPPPTPTP